VIVARVIMPGMIVAGMVVLALVRRVHGRLL
jgi:hypothetical protein